MGLRYISSSNLRHATLTTSESGRRPFQYIVRACELSHPEDPIVSIQRDGFALNLISIWLTVDALDKQTTSGEMQQTCGTKAVEFAISFGSSLSGDVHLHPCDNFVCFVWTPALP
jgi:hypothetical protein